MNEPGLQQLLERVTADLTAPADVAGSAWERARRQSRRTGVAVVGGAAVAAVLIVGLISGPLSSNRATRPSSTGRTVSTSQTSATAEVSFYDQLRRVIQPAWDTVPIDEFDRMDTRLPQRLDPASATTDLGSDPVASALAVAQMRGATIDLRVLGDDLRWRTLEVPGLRLRLSDSQAVYLLGGHPLSPDGTKLALPQPGSLLIVDLTSGDVRRIDLPSDGEPEWMGRATLWSPDEHHVLVGADSEFGYGTGVLVDVGTGSVRAVPYGPFFSAFAPDGTLTQVREGGCGFCELRRFDGAERIETVWLNFELYVPAPVINDDAMAVARAVRSWRGPKSAPINSDGVLVVDPADGQPLAMLPMLQFHQAENAELMGWLDHDTLVYTLVITGPEGTERLLQAWNYQTGTVTTLADPWAADAFDVTLAIGQI